MAASLEADGGLHRLDRPRVERAHLDERVAQQLAHHAEAMVGDRDAGRLDPLPQLLQRQLQWLAHDSTSLGCAAGLRMCAERNRRPPGWSRPVGWSDPQTPEDSEE